MKNWIIFTGLLCMLLVAGCASGTVIDNKNPTALRPVTLSNQSELMSPSASSGAGSGAVIDAKIYSSLAPCYSDHLIKSYGPVPVFTKDHQVISRGVMAEYNGTGRDAQYKKLNGLYEATKVSFDNRYSYPHGPVISYGYDALGSVTVGIYENNVTDAKTMDEMYSFIAAEARNQGIDNVPVIFSTEPIPQLNLGRTDMWRPIIGGVQTGSTAGPCTPCTVGFTASSATTPKL
jgi:hypothetical protein